MKVKVYDIHDNQIAEYGSLKEMFEKHKIKEKEDKQEGGSENEKVY